MSVELEQSMAKLGRRERNKLANRAAIIAAARRVFSSIGYEAASITDIVNQSNLSVGTFYNYFGDKDSLLKLILESLMEEIRIRIGAARDNAADLEHFVRDAFLAYVDTITQDDETLGLITKNIPVLRQFIFQGEQMGKLIRELERDLQQGIERGMIPPLPTQLISAAMIGATTEVISLKALDPSMDARHMANFLADLFLGGIERLGRVNKTATESP